MEKHEIPLVCFAFEGDDPSDIGLFETDNDRVLTLKIGKMSYDYSHIKPGIKMNGVCLRFTELEKTPEGKARGMCFYTNHLESLNHLINDLTEARNQIFGFNTNDQN